MQGLPVPGPVLGVAVGGPASPEEGKAMTLVIPKSRSRKVNGYVRAMLALETARRKREERYDRVIRPLDRKRDQLAAEVATRFRALSGGQHAAAQRLLALIAHAPVTPPVIQPRARLHGRVDGAGTARRVS